MTRAAGPRPTPRPPARPGPPRRARRAPWALLLCTALLLAGCEADGGGQGVRRVSDATCDGRIDGPAQITMWYHRPSARGELKALRAQVRAFNAAQDDVTVRLVRHPKGDHDELVRQAAADGELPDLLDFDAPKLFSHAWAGDLRPIDSCVPRPCARTCCPPSSNRAPTGAGCGAWAPSTPDSACTYGRRS